MLKVLLTRSDRENGMWLSLPFTPADIGIAYGALDNIDSENLHTSITDVESHIPNLRQYLIGKSPDDPKTLKELDFLAQRIEDFTDSEAGLFSGALDIEAIDTLADVINLTYSMGGYELYPDVTTTRELGVYLVESGEVPIHESAFPYVDYERVAAEYEANNSGTYTNEGYVVKTGGSLEHIYDGITLPDVNVDKEYIFKLKLISQYSYDMMEAPCALKLPTAEITLHQARDQLRVKNFDECEITEYECTIPKLSDKLHMDGDIYSLNRLAQQVKDMLQREGILQKLLAALEAEGPVGSGDALDIAEDIDRYELIPSSVITATDYAYYVLFESGRYDIYIDDEINSFVDYEKYGNYKMKEDDVVPTSQGLIRKEKQSEMQTVKFYSPLSIHACMPGSHEMSDISPSDAIWYREEILEAIEKELPNEGRKGLMAYFERDDALKKKVRSAHPTVEEYKGELWGVMITEIRGKLTESETRTLTDYFTGQYSDKWGAGFGQHGIRTSDGEIYVSFWDYPGYYIKSEMEFKQEQNIGSRTQWMGGM